jgi:hypothetical protein
MYSTKFKSEKKLQEDSTIVQSLINLRDELYFKKDPEHAEIFFKINSCLYRNYCVVEK